VTRANLLGYKTHADYVLDDTMAKTPAAVHKLLDQVWTPALATAKARPRELRADAEQGRRRRRAPALGLVVLRREAEEGQIRPRRRTLRPYFELKAVRQGAFDTANKLWA